MKSINKKSRVRHRGSNNTYVTKTKANIKPKAVSNRKMADKDISWTSISKSCNNRSTALKPKYDTSTKKRTSLSGSSAEIEKSRNHSNANRNGELVTRSNKHSVILKSVFQKNKTKQAEKYQLNNNDFPALS